VVQLQHVFASCSCLRAALTVNSDASPAPFSIRISLKPALSSVFTTVGVMATRFSPSKVSLGTPVASNIWC
jgi:hypothetical protein